MIACQKLVVATWVTVSTHTYIVDAVTQMGLLDNGLIGTLTAYQVADESGSPVYASQNVLSGPSQLINPYPNQFLRDTRLFKIFP